MYRHLLICSLVIFTLLTLTQFEASAQRFRLEELNNQEVELQFDAIKNKDQINFQWQTSTQVNIQSFELRKGMENGRYVDWETLTVVKNIESNKIYQFVDNLPVLGEMHYRLKLIAADGSSFEFSPIFKLPENIQITPDKSKGD
jgi:hypothetical protein